MGSWRVRHDWATFTFTFQQWPTPHCCQITFLSLSRNVHLSHSWCSVTACGMLYSERCRGKGINNGSPLQDSCLANPMDGGAWWAAVHGVAKSRTRLTTSLSCLGEGNGNPLQCSCLENPRDGGAWWAAVYGVTQSPTQLKWLSSSSKAREECCLCRYPFMCVPLFLAVLFTLLVLC